MMIKRQQTKTLGGGQGLEQAPFIAQGWGVAVCCGT